jgi:hypothetical protein
VDVIQMLVPGIFQVAALVADVPDVFIPAVDFFGRLGNGNVVGFGILNQFFPGGKIPGTPGSDDFQGRIEGLDGGLEPDLVVALAGTAVGDSCGTFFFGDFYQLLAIRGRAMEVPSR